MTDQGVAALQELVDAVEARARWSNKREDVISPRLEQALAVAKQYLAEQGAS